MESITQPISKPIKCPRVTRSPGRIAPSGDAYASPDAFLPERFVNAQPDRHSWIPFGGGVRRCLGYPLALMEMEEVVKAVGARVTLEPTSSEVEPTKRRYIVFGAARGGRVRIATVD
jgi:cytochrome P450